MQHAKTTAMSKSKANAPSAHLATNQNRDAKQKFGARMKRATRPVTTSKIFITTRQITTSHLPLGGNGLVLRPRMVSSSPNTSWMYGTMKIAKMD